MRCLDDETAALVLTRGLAPDELAAIEAHVDGCEECFALLATLAETMTPVPDANGEPQALDLDAAPTTAWKRGTCVGRYVLIEKVGAGGMGTVFAAEDPALDRTIAVKLVRRSIHSQRSNEGLLAEARMMAQLSHPNVVPVYDVGSQDDFVFLAMELIDGQNLREWLADGAGGAEGAGQQRSEADVVRVFLAAGKGLMAAHHAGLVHRDFKPDNVLVGKDGRVVVTDFGLAHSVLAPSDRVAGTPAYMAPEQRDGKVADAKSDQYSFAVALSEALTAERPNSNADGRRIPTRLARIVARGMATLPGDRFASMDELLAALGRDPARVLKRRLGVAAIAFGFAAVIGLFAWSSSSRAHACAEAVPAKLTGVWDAERKTAVRRAFVATGVPSAEAAFKSVEGALDVYAAGFLAMHVDACDAAFVKKEQSSQLFDLRVACLGERREELEAATKLFASADARVIAIAPSAARALTPVLPCGDARALLAIRAPKPAAAARVGELRRELARAKAMRDGGRLGDAITLARHVAEEADAVGYEPLRATALLQLGDAELANGHAEEAAQILERAALASDAARDDVTRVRALTRQLYAVGYVLERFEVAAALDAQVGSILARLGGDDELESDRLQTTGMIAYAERDFPEAASRLSRAIALREKTFGPRGRRVAMSRSSRCLVLFEEGELDAALADCSLAANIWTEQLGEAHPDLPLALKNIGAIELRRGKIDDGCRDVERALAIEEGVLAVDHPAIAVTAIYLADCRVARGDASGALALELRALAIREAKLGPRHRLTREALLRVGARYGSLGDPTHATPYLIRARAALGEVDAGSGSH